MTTDPLAGLVLPQEWWFVLRHEPQDSPPCPLDGKTLGLQVAVAAGFAPMPPKMMCTLCECQMLIAYSGPTPPGDPN